MTGRNTSTTISVVVLLLATACGSARAETTVSTTSESSVETAGASTTGSTELGCDSVSAGRAAEEAVQALVDRLVQGNESGDYEPAAALWTGLYAGPDPQLVLEELVAANPWLLDGEAVTVAVDAYGAPAFCPGQVVAVTDRERRGTFAVLVDSEGTIQRIQRADDLTGPPEITSPQVVLPTSPIEGGAVAYLESVRLADGAVVVDLSRDSTVISIPESNEGPRLLIVSMATPELPTAYSFVVPPSSP